MHDLGGPIGLHWTVRNPERVTRLALLNTLVYPQFSPAVIEFVTTLTTPGKREQATSPEGSPSWRATSCPMASRGSTG